MSDRNMDNNRSTRPGSVVLAASLLGLGILGAIAFMVIFALGEGEPFGRSLTQWLGASVAVATGGVGAGLIAWAHGLMPGGPDVEDRPFPAPNPRGRKEALEAFEKSKDSVGRRGLLGKLLGAAFGVLGLGALFPLRSIADDPFPERAETGWRKGLRLVNNDGEPVLAHDVKVNSALTVFPEGRVSEADSQTILLRVPPELIQPLPGRESWSPEGFIAYSKVCTHLGCPVGLYQTEAQRLLCPCHQSAFDVLDGAKPMFGPATRPLPQLPLEIDDDGHLVASDGYDRPIGPGFWTFPSLVGKEDR